MKKKKIKLHEVAKWYRRFDWKLLTDVEKS